MDAGEGDSDAVPFSRPHPRSKPQTVAENLHGNWNIEWGHVITLTEPIVSVIATFTAGNPRGACSIYES